jgi:hypothetical protein
VGANEASTAGDQNPLSFHFEHHGADGIAISPFKKSGQYKHTVPVSQLQRVPGRDESDVFLMAPRVHRGINDSQFGGPILEGRTSFDLGEEAANSATRFTREGLKGREDIGETSGSTPRTPAGCLESELSPAC